MEPESTLNLDVAAFVQRTAELLAEFNQRLTALESEMGVAAEVNSKLDDLCRDLGEVRKLAEALRVSRSPQRGPHDPRVN